MREGEANALCSLMAKEFFNVNGLRTRLDLNLTYGMDISVDGYVLLTRCLNHYIQRIRPNARNYGSCISIKEDYGSLKKPGKKIRTTLTNYRKKILRLRRRRVPSPF
jgi:hypothetical protein